MSQREKNITVGYDLTWMEKDNSWGGVFQYAERLVENMVELTGNNVVAFVRDAGRLRFEHLKPHRNFRLAQLDSTDGLARAARNHNVEVIHNPVQFFNQLTISVPMLTSLHDMQHFHFPEYFSKDEIQSRSTHYRQAAEFSERVIVSYDHVKKDIQRFYKIPDSKIDVCRVGLPSFKPPNQREFSAIKRKYNLPDQYLFYSANTWKHKNHIGLVQALKIVHDTYGIRISLVCTGIKTREFYPEIEAAVQRMGLDEFVKFIGYVSDQELRLLLTNAALVVVPTLYEAGSFPLQEAMAFEVPVICSNVTSLPEIIGDSRFTFDPKRADQIAERISVMLRDKDLIRQNKENSSRRVKEATFKGDVLSFDRSYREAIRSYNAKLKRNALWNHALEYELLVSKRADDQEARIARLDGAIRDAHSGIEVWKKEHGKVVEQQQHWEKQFSEDRNRFNQLTEEKERKITELVQSWEKASAATAFWQKEHGKVVEQQQHWEKQVREDSDRFNRLTEEKEQKITELVQSWEKASAAIAFWQKEHGTVVDQVRRWEGWFKEMQGERDHFKELQETTQAAIGRLQSEVENLTSDRNLWMAEHGKVVEITHQWEVWYKNLEDALEGYKKRDEWNVRLLANPFKYGIEFLKPLFRRNLRPWNRNSRK